MEKNILIRRGSVVAATCLIALTGGARTAWAASLGENLVGNNKSITNISTLTIGTATLPPAGGVANIIGNVHVNGSIFASNIGGVTTINAGNVSPGVFGSLTEGGVGNYTFRAADGTVLLKTDATSGYVGIGTPGPGAKLDISGGKLRLNDEGILLNRGTGTGYLVIQDGSGINKFTLQRSSTSGPTFMHTGGSNEDITFRSNWNTADILYIDTSAGNVGIGTTGPGAKLEVSGFATTATGFKVIAPANHNTILTQITRADNVSSPETKAALYIKDHLVNVPLRIDDQDSNAVFLVRGGNVGIGTIGPNHKLDVAGAYYSRQFTKGSLSGTVTVNWNDGNVQHITLTGNAALTFTNGQGGARYVLVLKQGGTGSNTVSWPANVRWPGSSAFTLTSAISKTDYVGFIYNSVDSTYDAVAFNANF